MPPRIALLSAKALSRRAAPRRADTEQYDQQWDMLAPAFAAAGLQLVEAEWPDESWLTADAALALAIWDYQDQPLAILDRLSGAQAQGVRVFNAPELIAWNMRKTYLRDLEARGVAVAPTLWAERPMIADINAAFAEFDASEVVLKRQVGAGASGQRRFRRGAATAEVMDPNAPILDRPGMIQPFLPAVVEEGEFSSCSWTVI